MSYRRNRRIRPSKGKTKIESKVVVRESKLAVRNPAILVIEQYLYAPVTRLVVSYIIGDNVTKETILMAVGSLSAVAGCWTDTFTQYDSYLHDPSNGENYLSRMQSIGDSMIFRSDIDTKTIATLIPDPTLSNKLMTHLDYVSRNPVKGEDGREMPPAKRYRILMKHKNDAVEIFHRYVNPMRSYYPGKLFKILMTDGLFRAKFTNALDLITLTGYATKPEDYKNCVQCRCVEFHKPSPGYIPDPNFCSAFCFFVHSTLFRLATGNIRSVS